MLLGLRLSFIPFPFVVLPARALLLGASGPCSSSAIRDNQVLLSLNPFSMPVVVFPSLKQLLYNKATKLSKMYCFWLQPSCPSSIARIISCDLCSLSVHFSNLLQLIWIQFYYLNPSVFCMMNRFYLRVIIFFWNKYIRRKWVRKAILWHLVTFFTQTTYCFRPPSTFLTLFSLW